MEWLEALLGGLSGVLTSSGLGAIVGLVGAIWQKKIEAENRKNELAHERAMAEIRTKEAAQEHEYALEVVKANIQVAQAEGEIQRDVAEMAAFTASQAAQTKEYGGWVDQIRGLMRPLLTSTLTIVFTALTFMVWRQSGGLDVLTSAQLVALLQEIVRTLMFLTVTAITWWFGSRPTQWKTIKSA